MPIKRSGANTVLSVTLLDTLLGNAQLVVRRRKRERLAQFDICGVIGWGMIWGIIL